MCQLEHTCQQMHTCQQLTALMKKLCMNPTDPCIWRIHARVRMRTRSGGVTERDRQKFSRWLRLHPSPPLPARFVTKIVITVSTNPLFCWSPTEGPSELFLSFLKLQLCLEPNVESRSQLENAGSHLGRLSTFSIDK